MPSEKPEDLYENAPFGYLSMSRDGRILTANHTMLDWTGYTLEQLSSKRIVDLLTVPTRILYETSYAPLLSMSGSFDGISVDLRTASGGTIALVEQGDTISIDIPNRTLRLEVTEIFLEAEYGRIQVSDLTNNQSEFTRLSAPRGNATRPKYRVNYGMRITEVDSKGAVVGDPLTNVVRDEIRRIGRARRYSAAVLVPAPAP